MPRILFLLVIYLLELEVARKPYKVWPSSRCSSLKTRWFHPYYSYTDLFYLLLPSGD